MDPFVAVALSMLPASRSRVASAFKEIRLQSDPGSDIGVDDALEAVLEACEVPGDERRTAIEVARSRADAALAAARTAGIEPLAWNDPRFPALLSCIPDPPPLLWVRGDADMLARPTVAIVGSRAATPYALDVAYRLGQELSDLRPGRGERPGARRGLGGSSRMPGGRRADGGRPWVGPRPHLSVGARDAGP